MPHIRATPALFDQSRRAIAGLCAALSLGACAAPQVIPAPLPPPTASRALATAHGHARANRHADVLAMAFRARQAGVRTAELAGLEIRSLWLTSRTLEAQQAESALALAAASDPDAVKALLDVTRFHLDERKQPADAWRALAPRLKTGCADHATCRTALQLLLATVPVAAQAPVRTQPDFAARALAAAPPEASAPVPARPSRSNWLKLLTERLAAQGNTDEAGLVLDAAAQATPADATLWIARFMLARRLGPDARAAWLTQVQGANLPAALLETLAIAPELGPERPTVAQVLMLASERPDATERHWILRALATVRLDDRPGLLRLATQHVARFHSAEARFALARGLLVTGQVDAAAPLIADGLGTKAPDGAQAEPALWQILKLDQDRRRASPATRLQLLAHARILATAAVQGARDKSAAGLLLGDLWRTDLVTDADGWLALAAEHPGVGQLVAARRTAARALHMERPLANATQAVQRYAKLLAAATVATVPVWLTDEVEPSPAWARQWLVRALDDRRTTWPEVRSGVLRTFADGGVIEPEMLRGLALRALEAHDSAMFLALDRQARAAAQATGTLLAVEPVVHELVKRSGLPLARWLGEADVHELEDLTLTWRVANSLLTGRHAVLGRRWAERALLRSAGYEPAMPIVLNLAKEGAADVALTLVRARQPKDTAQDFPYLTAEVAALVHLDRPDEASRRLLEFSLRADLHPRQLRTVVDLARESGLCPVVAELAPRLVADADVHNFRSGAERGAECARQLQREDVAQALVLAAQKGADPLKIETVARELAQHGFELAAITLFEALERQRPLSEEALYHWAKALLGVDRVAEAGQMLERTVRMNRGRSPRTYDRAAELLEDYGHLEPAWRLRSQAVALEPDNATWRSRLLANSLRQKRHVGLAEQVQALVRLGTPVEDLDPLLDLAERTDSLRLFHDAVVGIADADRELERFRLEIAARLGEREAVQTGVRRLRARGAVQGANVLRWLASVGAMREAREVAEDVLASPETTGSGPDRLRPLAWALKLRRDPTSNQEALALTRLYTGRALDASQAADEAARALAALGHLREAKAVAALVGPERAAVRALAFAGELEFRDGQTQAAQALWDRAMATVLLDGRLKEALKTYKFLPSVATYTQDPLYRELYELLSVLREAGETGRIARWLEELLALAPQSLLVHGRRIEARLLAGGAPAAAQALRDAANALPQLDVELKPLAERILRDGGRDVLLEWLLEDGAALPTEPWFVAFADAVLTEPLPPGTQPARREQVAILVEELHALAPFHPAIRASLALEWSGRGEAVRAARVLGQGPLSLPEPTSQPQPDDWRSVHVRAVASTLVALQGEVAVAQGETQKTNLQGWLRGWLARSRSWETTAALAAELVRQGHPALAQATLAMAKAPEHVGTAHDGLRDRLFVAAAAADDTATAAAALHLLRGIRGRLVPVQGSRLPSQAEVFQQLLQAGRPGAARQLALMIQESEPGLRPPEAIDLAAATTDAADVSRLARQFHPATWALLQDGQRRPASPAGLAPPSRLAPPAGLAPPMGLALPNELAMADAAAVQAFAAAADPALAEQVTAALAQRNDEAWRPWRDLVEHALAFEEPALARTALRRAADAKAPAGVLACPRLWLEPGGGLAACVRGRALAALDDDELADLAAAIGIGLDSPEGTDPQVLLLPSLTTASTSTLVRFFSAAASRVWALDATQRQRLTAFVRQVHAELMPPSRRDLLVLAGLDDLAALGLGDLGQAVCQAAWERDPQGRGQRNNLAYARFLNGEDPRKVLAFAAPAEFTSGGDPAYASLDTLAALHHAVAVPGGGAAAMKAGIALQKRTLAAALVPPDRHATGLGLPQARMAEMLLLAGQPDEARLFAAQALDHDDEPSTAQRARRVIKAVLRAGLEAAAK